MPQVPGFNKEERTMKMNQLDFKEFAKNISAIAILPSLPLNTNVLAVGNT